VDRVAVGTPKGRYNTQWLAKPGWNWVTKNDDITSVFLLITSSVAANGRKSYKTPGYLMMSSLGTPLDGRLVGGFMSGLPQSWPAVLRSWTLHPVESRQYWTTKLTHWCWLQKELRGQWGHRRCPGLDKHEQNPRRCIAWRGRVNLAELFWLNCWPHVASVRIE